MPDFFVCYFLYFVHIPGVSLGCRHDDDVVQADMGRTGDGEKDGVGNVFVGQGCHSFVYISGSFFITFILCFSISVRMALESASTACLVAQYTFPPG